MQATGISTDILDTLEARAAAGEDVYSDAVSLGITTTEDMEARRWHYAQLAAIVGKRYGDDTLGTFAKDVKLRPRTAQEYAQVWRFYPKNARRAFLDDCPSLLYSHFRTAMRMALKLVKDGKAEDAVGEALAFIEQCASEDWTAEKADAEAAKRSGKTVLSKVCEFEAELDKVTTFNVSFVSQYTKEARVLRDGKRYIVRVFEEGAE